MEIRHQTRKNTDDIKDLRESVQTVSEEVEYTNIEMLRMKATHKTCVQAFEHEIKEKVSSHQPNTRTNCKKNFVHRRTSYIHQYLQKNPADARI